MKTSIRYLFNVVLLLTVIAVSGCADVVKFADAGLYAPVGFLYGLWHGLILPFSFLISLFNDDVAVYAIYNSGGWYNFGFLLGIGNIYNYSSCSCSK